MNILLVEDDAGLVELVTASLEESEFSVMSFTSGAEALVYLKKQKPDLMLLDYSLPDMNGKGLIEALIKQQTTPPPFVITTGQGDERIAVDMMKLGARDYLIKDRLFLEKLPDVVKRVVKEIENEGKLRQAEVELKESEARFQGMVMDLMEGFYSVTVDGEVLIYNDEFVKILGLELKKDYTGLSLPDFWQNKNDRNVYLEELMKQGFIKNYTIKVKKLDGEKIVVQANARLIRDKEGNPKRIEGTFLDTTEQKKAEQDLQQNEERFRELVDTINSCVAIYKVVNDGKSGKNYIIQDFNRAALELEGLNKEDVIGKSLFDLRPTIDEYGLISIFRKVWKTGESEFYPAKVYVDNNFSNYYENRVFRIPSGEIIVVYDDVSDRENAANKIKKSQEQFDLAMNATKDGLFDWDLISNEIYYSPGWKSMLGYKEDELLNDFSIWEKLTKPEDAKRSWEMQQEVINKQRDRFEMESKMKHRDGHWVDILSRAEVVFDNKGKAVRMVGTHVNISELRKMEAEKIALEKKLQQAQKMEAIGTLAGGIAHDFNNILGIIVGYTDIVKRRTDPESDLFQDLDQVAIAADRATELVKQILAFSRQTQVECIPIKIQSLVKEGLKMLRSTIPSTIDIIADINPDCGPVIVDPTQVNQILLNLCTNAYHAMEKKGGKLTVVLRTTLINTADQEEFLLPTSGEFIELTISDNGTGISQENISKIFDPYFTTKIMGKGTGMGLAIIHGIVKKCDGAITVDSEIGKGSTFHIYLPIAANTITPEIKESDKTPMGNERILLIDDEELLITMNEIVLKELGYQVTAEGNSLEALKLFKKSPHEFDLVITDQTMPNMTGSDLAIEMLKIRKDIPIILCTGYSSLIDQASAKEIGIKGFALKPIAVNALAKLIRKSLNDEVLPR